MAEKAHLRSIQAEDMKLGSSYQRADIDAVDEYVGKVSDAIVQCRERGHPWPSSRDVTFSGVTPEGTLIERTDCPRCGCAYRIREWEAVRVGRGNWRYRPVGAARTQYRRNADGEKYGAPPGSGHISRRQIAESVVSAAFAGKSITEIRAEAKARARAMR